MTELTHSARRLNLLAEAMKSNCDLEVGVEKGQTFFDVKAPLKIAVDPEFRFDAKAHEGPANVFFSGFSDDFFLNYSGPVFDLVFLDGLHQFEQTLRDLMNVIVHSHEQTLILVDDVFPTDVYSSLRDHGDANGFRHRAGGEGEAWHGDVYKLVYYIHDFMPTLSYATIDDGWNRQTLIWKKPRAEFKPLFGDLETISRLSYFDMQKHVEIMRLMPEAEVLALAVRQISERSDEISKGNFFTDRPVSGLVQRVVRKVKNLIGD